MVLSKKYRNQYVADCFFFDDLNGIFALQNIFARNDWSGQ